MSHFHKDVDTDNCDAMVEFLRHHFRYWTMNSWNMLHSYANCIKLTHIIVRLRERNEPKDVDLDVWWEMLEMDDWHTQLGYLLDDWAGSNPGYQAGTNGRSGGYLVLYQTQNTRGLDEERDFDDWEMDDLRKRVQLVQSFDQLCDDVVDAYIHMCKTYKIVTEKITVPKTIRVLEEV